MYIRDVQFVFPYSRVLFPRKSKCQKAGNTGIPWNKPLKPLCYMQRVTRGVVVGYLSHGAQSQFCRVSLAATFKVVNVSVSASSFIAICRVWRRGGLATLKTGRGGQKELQLPQRKETRKDFNRCRMEKKTHECKY
jgi:hypothetical protein